MIPDAARVANGASAVLIIMVLLFNILARIIGKKYTKCIQGIIKEGKVWQLLKQRI